MKKKVEDKRFDGCPVCQAAKDGKTIELLVNSFTATQLAQAVYDNMPEPHRQMRRMLGLPSRFTHKNSY